MPASDLNFGPRLKELRIAAGYTQPDLAKAAGVSKGTVAALEQGASDPTWPTIQALCRVLKVDCTAFTQTAASAGAAGPGRPKKSILAEAAAALEEMEAEADAKPARKAPAGKPAAKKPGRKRG